jgi:hypothetical protein
MEGLKEAAKILSRGSGFPDHDLKRDLPNMTQEC